MSDKDYFEKLQKVLSQLVTQRSVSLDDTCLQKLIDRLRILCSVNNGEVEVEVFDDFLLNVKLDDDCLDENVKTFTVHLLGILGEKETSFRCLLKKELVGKSFEMLKKCVFSEDLSIQTAAFTSVRNITRHEAGLQWFLKTATEFIDKAFQVLKCGRSVFVVSSAQGFLVELLKSLTKFQLRTEDNCSQMCDKYCSVILQNVLTLILSSDYLNLSVHKKTANTDQLIGLHLVKAIYIENDIPGIKLDREKIDVIVKCLHQENTTVTGHVLDILESCYMSNEEDLAGHIESCVESTVEQLLHQGIILTSLSIAQRFFYRLPKSRSKNLETLAILPLDVVFSSDTTEEVKSNILFAMTTKSEFNRALSSAIPAITHQEGKDAFIRVAQLLRCTVGESVSGLMNGCKHLQGNGHIQTVILETLQQNLQDGKQHVCDDENVMREICRGLLSLTEDFNTPVQVQMPLFKTWKKVMSIYYRKQEDVELVYGEENPSCRGDNCDHSKGDNSGIEEKTRIGEMLDTLALCVEKKMCDLQWEVRDTAVAFVGELLVEKDNLPLLAWIKSNKMYICMWQGVKDQESYVRATTLTGIMRLVQAEPRSLLTIISMEELVGKCCDIIKTDSEAFPRRAAVDLLAILYNLLEFPTDSSLLVCTTMCQAAAKDFDWDVQLKAMDFWQSFIDTNFTSTEEDLSVPDYAKILTNGLQVKRKHDGSLVSGFEKLEKSGVFSVLFSCLKDSEQSVQEKACKMLINIKAKVLTNCKQANWENDNSDCKKTKTNQNELADVDSISKSKIAQTFDSVSVGEFMLQLGQVDLEGLLRVICQTSDEYERNPESLLDDILASFSENGSDTVMDCY